MSVNKQANKKLAGFLCKGSYRQALWPKFESQDSHIGRSEITPAHCPNLHMYALPQHTHTLKRCFSRNTSWTSMHRVNNCQQGLQWRSWRFFSARLKTRGLQRPCRSLRTAHSSKSATVNSFFLTIPINYIYSFLQETACHHDISMPYIKLKKIQRQTDRQSSELLVSSVFFLSSKAVSLKGCK